jgi:hypothetical protein
MILLVPAAPSVSQDGMAALEAVRSSASMMAAFAAALAGVPNTWRYSSAGSAPLSSAEARAAQPASVIWARVADVERLELLQHSSRRRQRTCRRRRRHEGSEALVAERVLMEIETLQRGPPPQGRREGHQPRVADGGVAQPEVREPRQGASV